MCQGPLFTPSDIDVRQLYGLEYFNYIIYLWFYTDKITLKYLYGIIFHEIWYLSIFLKSLHKCLFLYQHAEISSVKLLLKLLRHVFHINFTLFICAYVGIIIININ